MNKLHLIDCMEFMKDKPDNFYDLAIVDPPFGIGKDWMKDSRGRRNRRHTAFKTTYENDKPPDQKYFDELFRVSKNQIIWGYNYYAHMLPVTNYIIIWDKMRSVEKTFRSEAELAWTNIKIPMRIFNIRWDGCKKGKETGITTIHPHQKPILLYKLSLEKYAKPGWNLLDTHSGSGSFRIAAYDMGFTLDSCEKDKDIYKLNQDRFNHHIQQNELIGTDEIQKLIFK